MPVRVRWRGLELPVQVETNEESLSDTYGEFVVEPFERGFGHTIGNSLRRVLLSSLEGAAVVAVRIDGVQQEFTAMEGVREDVAEIILNIKELVLTLHPDEERTVKVEKEGEGPVTAGDIEDTADLEAANPDQLIATLTDDVKFSAELTIRKGRGYVPAEEHENLPETIGTIPIDALFSPVQRVAYDVANTRVGQRTNYDCLTIQIWTDGSVGPEMALVEGSKILRKYLNPFVQYFEIGQLLPQEEPHPLAPVEESEQPQVTESTLSMPLKALDLNARALNCLEGEGIKTVGELLEKTKNELLNIRNFGQVTLDELHEQLEKEGLEIGLLAPEE
ncbi:MAG: DNA-directed RNA polymerase subunit alpha [Candidatus Brocadiia bacterium]